MDSCDYYLTNAAIAATESAAKASYNPPRARAPLSRDPQLLNDRAVARIYGVSARTVWRMLENGQIPPPVRLSQRATR